MSSLENRSFIHVLLQVIGPALIALMVSSLVFFLIEVFYRGPHTARLYWVMGLFAAATVLVSRISIEQGKERAAVFGLALAAATLVTSLRLVQFSDQFPVFAGPAVLIALIAVVMWTSARLTWDCTLVDRSRDPSEMGLMEKLWRRSPDPAPAKTTVEKSPRLASFFLPRTGKQEPGSSVLRFALVALPVFGFGQWFVAAESRNWCFVLFAIYLGTSLGLLLITSLLGLERYLAKKNLQVPDAVARNWIVVGGLCTLLVMTGIMIVPRPPGLNSLEDLVAVLKTPIRAASDLAVGQDGQDRKENAKHKMADGEPEAEVARAHDDEPPGESTRQRKPGKAGDNSQDNPGDDARNDSQHQQHAGASPASPRGNQQPTDSGEPNEPDQGKPGQPDRSNVRDPPAEGHQARQPPQAARQAPSPQAARGRQQPAEGNNRRNVARLQPQLQRPNQNLRPFFYLAGLATLFVLAWMFRNEIAAWFGRRKRPDHNESDDAIPPTPVSLPSFDRFRDPFTSRQASNMSASQLARYSMAALDALARDLDIERELDQTATEFAKQWSTVDSELSTHAMQLAELYGRCAFGCENVSREDTQPLVALWRSMRTTFERVRLANRQRISN